MGEHPPTPSQAPPASSHARAFSVPTTPQPFPLNLPTPCSHPGLQASTSACWTGCTTCSSAAQRRRRRQAPTGLSRSMSQGEEAAGRNFFVQGVRAQASKERAGAAARAGGAGATARGYLCATSMHRALLEPQSSLPFSHSAIARPVPTSPPPRHSLGGALATLCAYDIRSQCPSTEYLVNVKCYTFGAPRTGGAGCGGATGPGLGLQCPWVRWVGGVLGGVAGCLWGSGTDACMAPPWAAWLTRAALATRHARSLHLRCSAPTHGHPGVVLAPWT